MSQTRKKADKHISIVKNQTHVNEWLPDSYSSIQFIFSIVITVHNVMGTLVQKTKKHITEICQQTVKTEMVYKSL